MHIRESKTKSLLGPLEEEIEFFFSNFFGTAYPTVYRKELCWKPPTDVYETEKNFVVILELAQTKVEEVSILFQEGVLIIRGIRKTVSPPERRRYHKMEINYGPFERKIAIPGGVDIENLSAHYREGFLEIRLPKRQVPPVNILEIEVE